MKMNTNMNKLTIYINSLFIMINIAFLYPYFVSLCLLLFIQSYNILVFCLFIHSFRCQSIHSFLHLIIHLIIYLFINFFINFVPSFLFICSLIDSLIHLYLHLCILFIYPFIHCPVFYSFINLFVH